MGSSDLTPSTIKRIRLSLHLTQAQFASPLGIGSHVTISRWETGASSPSPLALRLLRKLIDTPRCP